MAPVAHRPPRTRGPLRDRGLRTPSRGAVRCRSRCPARSARGATRMHATAACRATRSSPPPSNWRRPDSRRGTASSMRSRRRRRWSRPNSGPTPASSVSIDRTAEPGDRASASDCRPSRATLEALARDGFDAFYDGDLGDRQARGLGSRRIRHRALPTCASTVRPSTTRSASTIAASGSTTHPPNSSGVVALGDPRHPGAPHATRSRRVHGRRRDRPVVDPRRPGGVAAGDGGSRCVPDRPDVPRRADGDPAGSGAPGRPRREHRPASRGARPAATNPPGGGTIYLAVVDAEGNAVSLIESNYLGFGSGVVDPDTGVHYQDRGSYFSLDPDHPERP